MELRHLRYFVAVAEDQHITRAAARLGIQQPPLSQQIQALERELGVALFARSPRKITLNAAGKVFLSDARRILAAVEESVKRVRQFDLGEEGTLLVGMTSSASLHPRTMTVIEAFRSRYPLVSLQIEEGANHDLLHLVEEERLDVAFVRTGVERYPTLQNLNLAEERMTVALPIRHPMAANPEGEISLAELKDEDFVFFRQANGSGIGDTLLSACARLDFRPRIVNQTERLLSAVNMVAAGFGLAVVPKSLQAFRLPQVVFRDLALEGGFTVPLNVAFRQQADVEMLRRFLQVCQPVMDAGRKETSAPFEDADV